MEKRGAGVFARFRLFSALAVVGLFVLVSLLTLEHYRDAQNREGCAMNLRQLGQGMLLYHEEFHLWPDALGQLLVEDISAKVFVCPSSKDETLRGVTTREVTELAKPGRCSYVYAGPAAAALQSADVVVVYEPIANHGGEGANMLYGDGHVNWVEKARAIKVIAAAEAVRRPTSKPARWEVMRISVSRSRAARSIRAA